MKHVKSTGWDHDSDVVVVGAGHNGLAAAIVLADAGRSVVVLERNAEPGGAVRTAEVTVPGFRHDLMATNLNLFVGSPFLARYGDRLQGHGFDVAPSTRPVCSLFPNGAYVGVTTDMDETVELIRSYSSRDAEAFVAMRVEFDRIRLIFFRCWASHFRRPRPPVASWRVAAPSAVVGPLSWPDSLLSLPVILSRNILRAPRCGPSSRRGACTSTSLPTSQAGPCFRSLRPWRARRTE